MPILSKARPGAFGRTYPRVPVRERESGRLSDCRDVPAAGCLPRRLLRLGKTAAVSTKPRQVHAPRPPVPLVEIERVSGLLGLVKLCLEPRPFERLVRAEECQVSANWMRIPNAAAIRASIDQYPRPQLGTSPT